MRTEGGESGDKGDEDDEGLQEGGRSGRKEDIRINRPIGLARIARIAASNSLSLFSSCLCALA